MEPHGGGDADRYREGHPRLGPQLDENRRSYVLLDTDRAPSTSRKRDNAAGMVTVIRFFADEVFSGK